MTVFFNILIGSQLTYRAVQHMETTQFCGASCHVMKPEFTAYQNSCPFIVRFASIATWLPVPPAGWKANYRVHAS